MSIGGHPRVHIHPDDGVPPAVAPFAHATAAGPTLYVTGQMPTDVTGAVVGDDVATQTDQVWQPVAGHRAVWRRIGRRRAVRAFFSIGTTTSIQRRLRAWFPTGCPAAPAWAPPASPSAPLSRSTGCVGEATAGVTDIQL